MTSTPPGSPLRPHLASNDPEHPFGVFFSFDGVVRAALESGAFAQRLFPLPQFDYANLGGIFVTLRYLR